MRAYVVFPRRGTALDTQPDYVNAILGLVGITNMMPVYAEGLAMGEEKRKLGFVVARQDISPLVAPGDHNRYEVHYASA